MASMVMELLWQGGGGGGGSYGFVFLLVVTMGGRLARPHGRLILSVITSQALVSTQQPLLKTDGSPS